MSANNAFNLAMVPGQGIVPQPMPGIQPGYHNSNGISVLAPSNQMNYSSTGFNVNGAWPVNVVNGDGQAVDQFKRISPMPGQQNDFSGSVPNVYQPAMVPGMNPQFQPPSPNAYVVPSSDDTLSRMKAFNDQMGLAAKQANIQPRAPQPVPAQQQVPNPYAHDPAFSSRYAFPENIKAKEEQRKREAAAAKTVLQINPPSLGSAVSGTTKHASAGDLLVTDNNGMQLAGECDSILMDSGDSSTTMTIVNPSEEIEQVLRTAPIGSELMFTFEGSTVTNVSLPSGQTTFRAVVTHMVLNDAENKRKMFVLSIG